MPRGRVPRDKEEFTKMDALVRVDRQRGAKLVDHTLRYAEPEEVHAVHHGLRNGVVRDLDSPGVHATTCAPDPI